jgi:hypothetical protein
MTRLLDEAVKALEVLPPEEQEGLARVLLQITGAEQSEIRLSSDEEALFQKSFAEADRREFARDADVEAVWSKHTS